MALGRRASGVHLSLLGDRRSRGDSDVANAAGLVRPVLTEFASHRRLSTVSSVFNDYAGGSLSGTQQPLSGHSCDKHRGPTDDACLDVYRAA